MLHKTFRQCKALAALTPYLMAIPYILLLLMLPICAYNIVIQSLGVVPGLSDDLSLDAYISAFTSEYTLTGIGLSLYISIASTVPSIIIGVVLAWCIAVLQQESILGAIIAKLPQQIPHAVACVVMVNLFLPTGIIARVLAVLGFPDAADALNIVLYYPNSIGIIIEYIWKEAPFVTFMLLPSMSGISARLSEAARNLGASDLKTFLHVVLPNCMPTVRTCIIIVFVVVLGSYETPSLLGHATTRSLPVLSYAEYTFSNMAVHRPIAMALNMIMIVLALVFSLLYYYQGVKKNRKLRGDS